jgi:basic membrane lipoprotein Med (substrate-binding protein (PBP1-ABC) superfamily)
MIDHYSGLIAGKIAKSGHVGFIGGMDVPEQA